MTGKMLLDRMLHISNFDRNIARNKVQLERNKVFKIKYGCKRIIDYGQRRGARGAESGRAQPRPVTPEALKPRSTGEVSNPFDLGSPRRGEGC